jgi:cysteine desulfurase
MRKPSPYRRIYLDYASLTPVDKRVFVADDFANPSSIYMDGVRAKKALDGARVGCAQFLHAHADEIFFTGSGTEANNIALLGVVENLISKGKSYRDIHIIVSAIEHASVLEAARVLKRKGVHVDILPVSPDGIVDIQAFKKMLKPTTALVSVMMVNNEIGTIQPLADIVKIVRDFRKKKMGDASLADFSYPLVHTDACQAMLYTNINLEKLGVDMLTADSHKVYGPRSVGMLYVRRSALGLLSPIMHGGGQEHGLRPGTENVAGVVGFAKALEIVAQENKSKSKETETERLTKLRDYCIEQLLEKVPGLVVNGSRTERIANNVNISIPGIDHEFLLLQLDVRGISCSTKSSCLRDEDESYVIAAIRGGAQHDKKSVGRPRQSLRFTLGRQTTKKDIDYLVKSIDECIHL